MLLVFGGVVVVALLSNMAAVVALLVEEEEEKAIRSHTAPTQQRPRRRKDKMALDLFNLLFLFQLCYSHVAAAAAAVVESHSQGEFYLPTNKRTVSLFFPNNEYKEK